MRRFLSRNRNAAVPSDAHAIEAQGIEVSFAAGRQRRPILKGIDLTVPQGTIQLLMGPSGSGKTTLLSVLAALLTPDAGSVRLLGQDITRLPKRQLAPIRRHRIGFVFQTFNLFPALTASENVELVLNLNGQHGQRARQQAQLLLDRVEMGPYANQKPAQLSNGQKQRVAIARALAGEPPIVMADEPTAALDSQSGRNVIELMCHLARQKGCTVLIVTHDPRILDAADRITYLEDGMLQPERAMARPSG